VRAGIVRVKTVATAPLMICLMDEGVEGRV